MNINELTSSKFLKKDDFPEPALCTITKVTKENVAKPTEDKKIRGIMFFDGYDKGLVLNATNLKRAAAAFESTDTDDWLMKNIVVYYDPNVEFGGDIVGGLRLRAPKAQKPATPARRPTFDEAIDGEGDIGI